MLFYFVIEDVRVIDQLVLHFLEMSGSQEIIKVVKRMCLCQGVSLIYYTHPLVPTHSPQKGSVLR